MGNATSCAPSLVSHGVIKVLLFDGRLKVFTRTVKAAELMLENPGHFVCDSSNLKVGHRIIGLAADEELVRRQFYFVLPMELLYSVLTQEEMSSFTYKASKALRHGNSFNNLGKIFPVLNEFCLFPSVAKTADHSNILPVQAGSIVQPIERYKITKHRSWCPALETIIEAPS